VFVNPLRESGIITKEESIILFSNIDDIIGINSKFLADLKKIQESSDYVVDSIGKVLMDKLGLFDLYAPYCSNLTRSINYLRKKKEDPDFNAFLQVGLFLPLCQFCILNKQVFDKN